MGHEARGGGRRNRGGGGAMLLAAANALLLASALVLASGTPGAAQVSSERLTFEPGGGILFDAYRNDGGDGDPGWIGYARFGYELTGLPTSVRGGWRLVGEVARAETEDAGTAVLADTLTVSFRSEWWLATAGVEWDALGEWTGLAVDARAGAAWHQRDITGGDAMPDPGTPGTRAAHVHDARLAVVVGASAFRYLRHGLQVRLRVADVISDPFDRIEHSPAVTLGLRFSFD